MIVISPTGLPDPLPERFEGRPIYVHDEALVATRATREECRQLAAEVARKLNGARGPTVLFVPLRGLSLLSTEGQALYEPEATGALFAALRQLVDPERVELHEVDTDINDPAFALAMAERLHALMTGATG